jgi:hypothetical protein
MGNYQMAGVGTQAGEQKIFEISLHRALASFGKGRSSIERLGSVAWLPGSWLSFPLTRRIRD